MKTKSMIAGEYTAPPAHGPMTAAICGTTPEARVLRRKMSAYPASETTPSWIRAPPESLRPMIGTPVFMARSITLQILRAYASESEPPNTVKSCAKTNTGRPWMRPDPVTTPSPGIRCSAMSKSCVWWTTKRSTSRNESGSSSSSSRSRAVFLPALCWRRMRSSPPPSSAARLRRRSSSRRSSGDMAMIIISVSMQPWAQAVLVGCAVVLTAAAVPAILALRRMARRAETVLTIVEQELRPLIGQVHALSEDVRTLSREAKEEIERVGEMTEHVNAVADGVGRAVTGLAGLTRAGQLIGVAVGLKKGLDVFVSRFAKAQGDHHGG